MTLHKQAPSEPDRYNGIFAAAIFAGSGFALVAPDYPGFGSSSEPHAYYHTPSIASSVVNQIRAAGRLLRQQDRAFSTDLFLTGFSQGGYASYAAHRMLELDAVHPWQLRGTAGIAGPLDIADIGFPNALKGSSRFGSLYVTWVALSYARVYGHPVTDILREPWADIAPGLFDGNKDGAAIPTALPKDPKVLLTPALLTAVREGKNHWFLARLRDNSILDWTPAIPVRGYFGSLDVEVPSQDVLALADRAQREGFPFEAIPLGTFDHDGSILAAAPEVLAWFETLRAPPLRHKHRPMPSNRLDTRNGLVQSWTQRGGHNEDTPRGYASHPAAPPRRFTDLHQLVPVELTAYEDSFPGNEYLHQGRHLLP